MRNRLLPLALLILAGSASVLGQAPSRAATEKALIANENKLNEAVAKGDVKTFTSLLTPDALSGGMMAFMKAADFGKTMGEMKIATWHLMDTQVVWIDDKSAIVAYTWMGAGTYKGQPVPGMTYASTVWTERGGKWLAVFHQESAPPPPPPPARKK